jgi:O-antigen/teichoic acid export membrane protein
MYFDRFLFGALISVAAVGFFTPPSMIASKLGILHGGLLLTLFPAFCVAHGRGDDGWMRDAFVRALKLLVLVVGAACVLLIFFARPILELWVGAEFARRGTVVLQVLCIGVFFNALTHVPVAMLQGVGRADLTAKLQMVQVPIHVALVSVLTWRFGLEGGALAWTVRMVFECALFIGAGVRVKQLSLRTLFGPQLQRSIAIVALLAAGLVIAAALTETLLGHIILAGTVTTFFTFATWLYVFDNAERSQVRALLRVGS